jgi:hypothetical protein
MTENGQKKLFERALEQIERHMRFVKQFRTMCSEGWIRNTNVKNGEKDE